MFSGIGSREKGSRDGSVVASRKHDSSFLPFAEINPPEHGREEQKELVRRWTKDARGRNHLFTRRSESGETARKRQLRAAVQPKCAPVCSPCDHPLRATEESGCVRAQRDRARCALTQDPFTLMTRMHAQGSDVPFSLSRLSRDPTRDPSARFSSKGITRTRRSKNGFSSAARSSRYEPRLDEIRIKGVASLSLFTIRFGAARSRDAVQIARFIPDKFIRGARVATLLPF